MRSVGKNPRGGDTTWFLPPVDREAAYKRMVKREMERAETFFRAGIEGAAKVVLMTIDGGPCARCGRMWKEVQVDNPFAQFRYFKPDCGCYPKCSRCGYVHAEEVEAGQNTGWCARCGKMLNATRRQETSEKTASNLFDTTQNEES